MVETRGNWSDYELKAWKDIQARKRSWFEASEIDSWANRTGKKIAKKSEGASKAVKKVPGVKGAGAAMNLAVAKAQTGLGDLSASTLSEKSLLKTYGKRGIAVSGLAELRALDLETLDAVVRRRRLDRRYGAIAAAEGLAAGAVVSGGEALASFGSVASAGAAAAPGFGTVAVAMAGDAAMLVAITSRVVADTAMHFGFDPNDPKEQVFAMSVINVGSAVTQGAKYTALADLSRMAQSLARRAPWKELNAFVLARVAQKFADQFTVRLTQRKLGQLVPVAGMFIGSALNYGLVKQVQEAAYWAYRERLLLEKNPNAGAELDAEVREWEPEGFEAMLGPEIAVSELVEAAENEVAT